MTDYVVKPLGADTWDAFARLADTVWSGCWCTWFHTMWAEKRTNTETGREMKGRLVNEGRAHAALVFAGELAVAWCQYGTPEELPNIHHRKDYEAGLDILPDYRFTCIYVDKKYRRQELARAALHGAMDLIAKAGGGVVEGYPQDTAGKQVKPAFLYNGTRTLYEQAGFTYIRPKGKGHCVMRMEIK